MIFGRRRSNEEKPDGGQTAQRIEDLPAKDRYNVYRLKALINQTVEEPWLKEVFNGLYLSRE